MDGEHKTEISLCCAEGKRWKPLTDEPGEVDRVATWNKWNSPVIFSAVLLAMGRFRACWRVGHWAGRQTVGEWLALWAGEGESSAGRGVWIGAREERKWHRGRNKMEWKIWWLCPCSEGEKPERSDWMGNAGLGFLRHPWNLWFICCWRCDQNVKQSCLAHLCC